VVGAPECGKTVYLATLSHVLGCWPPLTVTTTAPFTVTT
jgi:hypothetical protein